MPIIERYLIYLGVLVGLLGFSYYKGYDSAREKAKSENDKVAAQAFEQYKKDSERITQLSVNLAEAQAKTNTVYKTITNTVEREIHEKPILTTTRCFDDGVMRIFNADITDKQPAYSGQSPDSMRTTAAP